MRIIRFIILLLFPAQFLHQAYTWDNDTEAGALEVEFVMFGKDHDGRIESGPRWLRWYSALWQAAK